MLSRAKIFENIPGAMYEPMLVGELFSEKREMTLPEFQERIGDIKAFLDYYEKAAKKIEKEGKEYEELKEKIDNYVAANCGQDYCEL